MDAFSEIREEKSIQCYYCGRAVPIRYITERIEPRLATRYHGKRVKICIYCAEEWDDEFPESKPADAPIPAEPPEESAEPAPEAPIQVQEQPLTRRQAERLSWYHNVSPVRGYDVKSAILKDDAFGAVAHEAELRGLSYGYYMVQKEAGSK